VFFFYLPRRRFLKKVPDDPGVLEVFPLFVGQQKGAFLFVGKEGFRLFNGWSSSFTVGGQVH